MGFKFPYKQLNERGIENETFLEAISEIVEDPKIFDRDCEEYKSLCDKYLKKLGNKPVYFNEYSIKEEFRDSYNNLFTFFLKKLVPILIESLNHKQNKYIYKKIKSIKLDIDKKATEPDVVRWFACFAMSSNFVQSKLAFENITIHFWEDYIIFLQKSKVIPDDESNVFIARFFIWKIALALRKLMKMEIFKTKNQFVVYRWFEGFHYIKKGEEITAKRLYKAYDNKIHNSNKGKSEDEILEEESHDIDDLVKFFKKLLKKS